MIPRTLVVVLFTISAIYAFPQQQITPSYTYGVAPVESVEHSSVPTGPLENLSDVLNTKVEQAINAKAVNFVTPFPESGRKTAVLESASKESLPIQLDMKYGNLQQFVSNIFNPQPIVDNIQEHEKYGNDGGKGRAIGNFLVGAFEGVSNAINAAVDVPFQTAKTIGKKITNSLNQIGGKLVGLAK
ncbi:uncharacterized protein LOC143205094 [Rhynchophorus ferrugineus]|uniref:uncharacterized protein LOC143205094 n=1 Tax=Rhynchophorus ferrugineus TaxID=354439 RepID=UPI003FCD308F